MKVSLLITKGRAKYIVDHFAEGRVTVIDGGYNGFGDCDEVIFEVRDQLDFLDMFHAGIRYGFDMALSRKNESDIIG